MEIWKFVMLYQYGMLLLEMYYLNNIVVRYMARRVEYHSVLIWHLEFDMEKVILKWMADAQTGWNR